jgi:hypothetical protein
MSEEKNTVESTSDDRTVNNLMRHQYRVLTDDEKLDMSRIKDAGLYFVQQLHIIGGTAPEDGDIQNETDRQASRELALAQTKIEEAVMWAVKHITR